MKRSYVIIIKNAFDGRQIKIDDASELTIQQQQAIIEAYTDKWMQNNQGYYVSYLYEQ